MKITKSEIKYPGLLILVFSILNILTNFLGLWIAKLLKANDLAHLDSFFKEFVRPIGIQMLLFALVTSAVFLFFRRRKFVFYAFAVIQTVVFHIIFFLNVSTAHSIHFITSINGVGIKYLSFFGQYLIDLLYLRFPLKGTFDETVFLPFNIGTFYIHWILLNLIYYFVITWLAIILTNTFTKKRTD